MSVLVEALSLVVPRKVLDVSYPGGTDAFLEKLLDPSFSCRFTCADDDLVSVSFFATVDAQVAFAELTSAGIVAIDDGKFYEIAYLEQGKGPTIPCDWLEWQKHGEGYTSCWLAGTDPGRFHAPPDWTPEQSLRLTFQDWRETPGRCLRLAVNADGMEVWLDFETGDIAALEPLSPNVASPEIGEGERKRLAEDQSPANRREVNSSEGALCRVVRSMLDSKGYTYQQITPEPLSFVQPGAVGNYMVYFTTNDQTDFVGLSIMYGSKIPENRRLALAEAVCRINHLLWIGNFELDFETGDLRCRFGMDVEGGLMSETMVSNMFGCLLHSVERYHQPLMRIAYGNVEPEAALKSVV
jgi:hypothetical protein